LELLILLVGTHTTFGVPANFVQQAGTTAAPQAAGVLVQAGAAFGTLAAIYCVDATATVVMDMKVRIAIHMLHVPLQTSPALTVILVVIL